MTFNKNRLFIGFACLSLILSACGPKPSDNSSITFIPGTEGAKAFSDVTTFEGEVDFHTAAQNAFIDYIEEGNYEDLTEAYIKENFGCDGKKELSLPEPIKLSFEQTAGEGFKNYELQLADNPLFEGARNYAVSAEEKSIDVYNLLKGTTYYYRFVANYEDDEQAVSNTYTLTTTSRGPRNLKIDGMTNCRDLGGKETVDGGYIKQGLLYRTAALDDSQSGSIITEEGKTRMIADMAPRTEIELRGGANGNGGEAKKETSSALNDEINFQFVPFAYSGGKNLLFRNVEPVKKVFEILSVEENYPIFFHCRIGTDRTGLIALLVNALCGLPLEEIYQDYLFSDFGTIGKVPTVGQANEDSIAEYVQELLAFEGYQLQNSVYNFLLSAGVPAYQLDNIIDILTTEDAVTGNEADKTHVAALDSLKLDSDIKTTAVTATRQPVKYATFSAAAQKVTYEFTSSEAFNAKLFANLTSRTVSGTLDSMFKVTLNGEEIKVASTSLATASLGFDRSIDCWIPSEFASISVPKTEGNDTNVLTIESKGTTAISLSQIAFSCMNKASQIVAK